MATYTVSGTYQAIAPGIIQVRYINFELLQAGLLSISAVNGTNGANGGLAQNILFTADADGLPLQSYGSGGGGLDPGRYVLAISEANLSIGEARSGRNADDDVPPFTYTVTFTEDYGLVMTPPREAVVGTDGGEVLTGTDFGEGIIGHGGDDQVFAAGGDDTIQLVGAGYRRVDGGEGSDRLLIDWSHLSAAIGAYAEGGYTGGFRSSDGLSTVAFREVEHLTVIGGSGADEIATGSGDDVVRGGAGDDMVSTGGGSDSVLVAGGTNAADTASDTAHLGTGARDVLEVDYRNVTEAVTMAPTVDSADGTAGSIALAGATRTTFSGVERLVLWGGVADDILYGAVGDDLVRAGDGSDVLHGNSGADILRGMAGADILYGGEGDDGLYYQPGETAAENDEAHGGAGTDLLSADFSRSVSAVTGTLLDNGADGYSGQLTNNADRRVSFTGIETFYFIGSEYDDVVTGGAGDDTLIGNGGANDLDGGDGNDFLAGGTWDGDRLVGGEGDDVLQSGIGADEMIGGDGDDLYYVDTAGDVIVETPEGGVDEVIADMDSYTLAEGVENLTGNWNWHQALTGNSADNRIVSGTGYDRLDGGLGADLMMAGDGDDVYVVDNVGDTVVEEAGKGQDTVETSLASYTIGANVEKLTGLSAAGQRLTGNGLDNVIRGNSGNDALYLQEGGVDTASGGGGDDGFVMGGAMTSADAVDGGAGNDQLVLQGDYATAPLTLGAGVVNLESIALLRANNTLFGGQGNGLFSYNITTVTQNVAPGGLLIVDGAQLRVGENFTFNGAAETDGGGYKLYGGYGIETLTGGTSADLFYFNEGRFGSSDTVRGGAGSGRDELGLGGDYTVTFGADQIHGIEVLALLSGRDRSSQTDFDYNLTMHDGNVASGTQLIVDAAQLKEAEHLTFDGRAESNGTFRIFGGRSDDAITAGQGADIVNGRAGNDTLRGWFGADTLSGGAGNDRFVYGLLAESLPDQRDTVSDFTLGDLIDLSAFDTDGSTAGDDAFSYIGSAAYSANGTAEVRTVQQGNVWFVSADLDGNGSDDLAINVTVADGQPLTQDSFVL